MLVVCGELCPDSFDHATDESDLAAAALKLVEFSPWDAVLVLLAQHSDFQVGVEADPDAPVQIAGFLENRLAILENIGRQEVGIRHGELATNGFVANDFVEVEFAEFELKVTITKIVLRRRFKAWHEKHHEFLELLGGIQALVWSDDEVNRMGPALKAAWEVVDFSG